MKNEIEIPEGHEARIEGNKVVIVPKESEDDRIRKRLVERLKVSLKGAEEQDAAGCSRQKDIEAYKWGIAYLERQKETTSVASIQEAYRKGFNNAIEAVKQKPEKYGLQKEQKPILEVFGFKVGDAVRLKDGDGRKHIIKSFEEVEGLHGLTFYHVEFEDNSARDSIYPGEQYSNGYYTKMEKIEEEQQPAEWSDEDKTSGWTGVDLERYLNCLQRLGTGNPQQPETINSKWFKEHCRPQPKQEWSEEDKGNLLDVKTIIDQAWHNQDAREWIERSEEELESLWNWLNNIWTRVQYPQPHWKPSDAQIQALEFVLYYHAFAGPKIKEQINSLYDDLKRQ